MIPAGYLLKRVVAPPDWLQKQQAPMQDVCSVSNCVNGDVVDLKDGWKSNSFGLANSPDILWSLVKKTRTDLTNSRLLFYTAYELELDSDGDVFDAASWQARSAISSQGVADDVELPDAGTVVTLLGFDIVSRENFIEHSPLSCNSLAKDWEVNEHCLFDQFNDAIRALTSGKFGIGIEQGLYTIFGVYAVTCPVG